ncbi:2-succinyl-5-enolpyruvyl-6-hydroxy-3-cyclohexene-1-carboxylic-acid synthase [Schaalia sp. 19OD2882]|uniref:2-succinyl-5-enolpyruvyl-6-hydroxy-3- cyclohexene-1-carboxylic-acid synthase n=1 Tax=Schaalia sp. 19OD2882 TaxID=2794089 RepID=UPI001C1F19C7|nr:2-succinyl-5-enolpyruvyl-6-hydroxy-3-cyclohexene-1-carboxylic-acid synthase [Schaalia sp. 19OD2882]QWW19872.1 2-succinyl-5-enolpyruvyl-6-hydroxy-3-cyclohexene-1-carboxylic-acid synthase [Schaalia sp. 19OD2882]
MDTSDQVAGCSHPSERLAMTLLRALAGAGVRDVVACPGSRSAPFAYALDTAVAEGWLRAHVRVDERSAAFLALGLSRGCQDGPLPVALVTTSGGAVAELHAGVAEADHAHMPLVVLSADRPFEMRGVGASQTTVQPGIFGPHVRGVWDVPAGFDEDGALASTIARAVALAMGAPTGTPGPVHVNVGFRDPLVPAWIHEAASGAAMTRPGSGGPLPVPEVRRADLVPTAWEEVVRTDLRTLVLAGDQADPAALDWARAAGVPLVGEPSSGLRGSEVCLPHQQSLLVHPDFGGGVEQVVLTGRPTLSRAVSALLARPEVRVVIQWSHAQWPDVAGNADVVVAALASAVAPHDDLAWPAAWKEASQEAGRRIVDLLEGAEADSWMLAAARIVWESACPQLVVGASNSVRALDLVAGSGGPGRVLANRGLAGIDGTVATAIGVALAAGVPTTALMGDLTFLHDVGALAVPAGEKRPDLRIVVMDDQGGSIFAALEHGAAPRDVHDRWFRTAQPTALEPLCRAHGATYRSVECVTDLRSVLARPIHGIEVVHLRVLADPQGFTAVREVLLDGRGTHS